MAGRLCARLLLQQGRRMAFPVPVDILELLIFILAAVETASHSDVSVQFAQDPQFGVNGTLTKTMTVYSVQVTNRCSRPVFFREGYNTKLDAGATKRFTDPASISMGNRLSFSYDSSLFANMAWGVTERMQFLEMAISKWPLGKPIKQGGFNFISQAGFIDMNMEIAGWKDEPGGQLVCNDARAKTSYNMRDCRRIGDASVENKDLPEDGTYERCRSQYGSACPRCVDATPGCTAQYAAYVDDHSHLYNPTTGRWINQARSVGALAMGFKTAKFADGRTAPSTPNGRESSGVGVNFECWELPCLDNKDYCRQRGYVSTGMQGFMYCNEIGNIEIGTLEVILCPEGSGWNVWWAALLLLALLSSCILCAWTRRRCRGPFGSAREPLVATEMLSQRNRRVGRKPYVWADGPADVQQNQAALVKDIKKCHDALADIACFENTCEELFGSLRIHLRNCPRDAPKPGASTTLGALPGKEAVWDFLLLVAERRPPYRARVAEVADILESSLPWQKVLKQQADLMQRRKQLPAARASASVVPR
eukprot:TRINITY_DN19914_c0_g4_i1.p1 TRINITY_DN19914_c0_g4~~TRINITY_DN19914_c0_g4_i1.p1  ORF type:complete len:536 (-),score=66.62 TRINITY_DN19914_c0_g4_i1:160-1767(-)